MRTIRRWIADKLFRLALIIGGEGFFDDLLELIAETQDQEWMS